MERQAERVLMRANARLRHGADRTAPAISAGPRRLARARALETIRRLRTGGRRTRSVGRSGISGRASRPRRIAAGCSPRRLPNSPTWRSAPQPTPASGLFLHLPVPQPPGIDDRATERLTAWNFSREGEGYFDNLALPDRIVVELRRGLDRAHLGDLMWIVVSPTRSWRASKQLRWADRPARAVPRAAARRADKPCGRRVQHAGHTRAAAGDPAGSISDASDAANWLVRA